MAHLVWLITGCSSGIGQELVKQALARGDKVIATARRLESIQSLKDAGASVLKLDVTDEPDVINAVVAEAINIHGRIDVLVNNAGFMVAGTVEEVRCVLQKPCRKQPRKWTKQSDVIARSSSRPSSTQTILASSRSRRQSCHTSDSAALAQLPSSGPCPAGSATLS
jgi:NAD(P)-dependent dehydrogenase (short-subunit alcohol dehydrogenase family)